MNGSPALADRIARPDAVVAGVLSGTSGDGIDVVLARPVVTGGRLEALSALAFSTEPFPGDLAGRVRSLLDTGGGEGTSLRQIGLLHRDLGRAFGEAVAHVAGRAGLVADLVGSHGQTVWHHDGLEDGAATLQLGDGDLVAESAGCAVASDFRQRDVAAGGEGAPLSAYADPILFAGAPRPTCVLNLGGIANLTWIGGGGVRAFDTGPANALLDGLARRLLGEPFDRDGAAAAAGRADPGAVARELEHPFFEAPAPKSTGRDTFGETWLEGFLERVSGSPGDRLATAVAVVAEGVARGLELLPGRPGALHLAGGGAHNKALVEALEGATGLPAASTAELGVDPDAREALVFAALGVRLALGEPSTDPEITGARAGRILGKLSPVAP